MKKIIILILILFSCVSIAEAKTAAKKQATKKQSTKKQFIDLEGLDIQGMIDRPQTMYILKRSDLIFDENYDEYDYMSAIIDITYKEPF
ncbi:MAG: hypothetical protein WCQ47_03910 [bacterium]